MCTNIENRLQDMLSLNLNLSPLFTPLVQFHGKGLEKTHTHTVYAHVKHEGVSMSASLDTTLPVDFAPHTLGYHPHIAFFTNLSVRLSLASSTSIMCDPVQLAVFPCLFDE